ncbi:hypothetical protein LRP52_38640, partial [Photobacterium sp. ZSDE20]|nr:hypothetical protein [Photobacterium sp. ZSDE20]
RKASDEDEEMTWDEVTEYGGIYPCLANKDCSEASLTKFSVVEFDDSDDDEEPGSELRKDILSASYDRTTGVYTEVKNRTNLNGYYVGRQSESISFTYLVDGPESERYVDFTGTWRAVATRLGCDSVAESTYEFNSDGVVVKGMEFSSDCELEELDETVSYADLAAMDYWWFTTNGEGHESKATLAQLNSTIRWCDSDDLESSDVCDDKDIKINRWEYIPAGKDWDLGVLNRRTLGASGDIKSTISMYKN